MRARELADRHYSRQTRGARDFMGPGRLLVLVTADGLAVWGAIENLGPRGGVRWRVSIFRNEGPRLSSELVREATALTYAWWSEHYGRLPASVLTTEIDAAATSRRRGKKNPPGQCFILAGWRYRGIGPSRRKLHVLEAPSEEESRAAA